MAFTSWHWKTDKVQHIEHPDKHAVNQIAWDPTGTNLLLGTMQQSASIWNESNRQMTDDLVGNEAEIRSVDWSSQGRFLLTHSRSSLRVWDLKKSPPYQTVRANDFGSKASFHWVNPGELELAGRFQSSKFLRGKNQAHFVLKKRYPKQTVSYLTTHSSGEWQVGLHDGQFKVWKSGEVLQSPPIATMEEYSKLKSHSVFDVSWNPVDQTVLIAMFYWGTQEEPDECKVFIWNPFENTIQKLPDSSAIKKVCWSNDGNEIAYIKQQLKIGVWNAKTKKRVFESGLEVGKVFNFCWSSDDQWIAYGGSSGSVTIVDSKSGELIRKLMGHTGAIESICWAPGGQRLATAGQDQTARIWDFDSGQTTMILKHELPVAAVSWDPTGRVLSSASFEPGSFIVNFWDARRGYEISNSNDAGVSTIDTGHFPSLRE